MSGANTWLINAIYTGGSGDVDCMGFPIGFTVPNTAAQPTGIPDANGAYMHIASTEAVADGILNASFAAADGFCTDPGSHFSRMEQDLNTVGMTNTSLSFWWLCNGGSQSFGEVHYSTNGGTTWNLITAPFAQYNGQASWVEQTIALPEFNGQETLRFGFRFVNNSSLSGGSDPSFGVDEILVTADEINVGIGHNSQEQVEVSQDPQGSWSIRATSTIQHVMVHDVLGHALNSAMISIHDAQAIVHMEGHGTGCYIITVSTDKGQHSVRVLQP